MTHERHHGLSAREQEIMDLHDAGETIGAIAKTLTLKAPYIRATVQKYDFSLCWSNTARFERGVRKSERAYCEALVASGGRYA